MRLTTKAAGAAAAAVVTLASTAAAQTPPNIPAPQLPNTDVERFKVTVNGSQGSSFEFSFDPPAGACVYHAEGKLTEMWRFQRGKGVVIEFRRIPGTRTVFLQRTGRPLGDVAFAVPGTVLRTAVGHWSETGPAGCRGKHNFAVTDCGEELPAKADMRFIWAGGRLTMETTSRTQQRKNPALECGSGGDYIDGFSWEYPFLAKQRVKLGTRVIFGKRKHIRLSLAAKELLPLREGSFLRQDEVFGGKATLILSRQ